MRTSPLTLWILGGVVLTGVAWGQQPRGEGPAAAAE